MNSQSGDLKRYDILVIGSGLAGLYYCLSIHKQRPKSSIALISKTKMQECNSYYAQGGIASAQNNNDLKQHIQDTIEAGAHLSNKANTLTILSHGPDIIEQLIKFGTPFNKNQQSFTLAQEGGHSNRRIYHCGDETGKIIWQALFEEINTISNIDIYDNHTAINLIKQTNIHTINKPDQVIGAYILDNKLEKIDSFIADVTILASGGAGKVYRYTTNPAVATGDGIAMAFRAGARIGNMEFIQFHPTLLYHPTLNNFLISEAVRGEGAILKNIEGEAFMHKYAPRDKDLATRDIVARAIFNEIEQQNDSYVYLDIRHQSQTFLKQRFPKIYSTLRSVGIDMSTDMIPVVPAAHYLCGGVLTDPNGRTDLNRLFVIGESAFTGLHGANRLASNSLLEACAMAKSAANESITWLEQPLLSTVKVKPWISGNEINPRRASQINVHWRGLRGEMTSYAGIVRTQAGLDDLLKLIKTRKQIIEDYYWQHHITKDLIELRNIICIAELIVKSALNRCESRGGHYREDFPTSLGSAIESIISPNLEQIIKTQDPI